MAFIAVVGHGAGSQCNEQLLLVCWADWETAPLAPVPYACVLFHHESPVVHASIAMLCRMVRRLERDRDRPQVNCPVPIQGALAVVEMLQK